MTWIVTICTGYLSLLAPPQLVAKADTVKITITGPDLKIPIEITEIDIVRRFKVWAGAGTSSNDPKSLIIDWSQGPVSSATERHRRYQVSFYAKVQNERVVYFVFYEYDSSTRQGYVYLPGSKDQWFSLNTRTILHGVEGNWFYAWKDWDNVAQPLIATAHAKLNPERH